MEFAIVRTPFFCFSAFSCEHECDECEKNNNKIVEMPDIYHESAIIEEIHQQYKNYQNGVCQFSDSVFSSFSSFSSLVSFLPNFSSERTRPAKVSTIPARLKTVICSWSTIAAAMTVIGGMA